MQRPFVNLGRVKVTLVTHTSFFLLRKCIDDVARFCSMECISPSLDYLLSTHVDVGRPFEAHFDGPDLVADEPAAELAFSEITLDTSVLFLRSYETIALYCNNLL